MNVLFSSITQLIQNFTRTAHVFLFSLILLFISVIPASAKQSQTLTQISSVYFNTPNSFVVETATVKNLSPFASEKISTNRYKLSFADVALAAKLPKNINNDGYEIQILEHKSPTRRFFQSKDQLDIVITCKNNGDNLQINPRELLLGFASEYQIKSTDGKLARQTDAPAPQQEIPKSAETITQSQEIPELPHQLTAVFQSIDLSATQEFLAKLNQADLQRHLSAAEFHNHVANKMDALALTQIAELLVAQGHDDKAVSAFRRVLNLDPNNHQAKLGLAKLTTDEDEKLNNYLASIEIESLLALANSWSARTTNPEALAKSLLAYQLAIIKDPYNPNYRLDCARLLESMGSPQYTLAAKRYLEAAALAKNSYLSGDLNIEPLLRDATESLIKVLSKQGEAELALKYCNSYLDLGFKRFINGKPIIAVIKELKQNQNPFVQG